MSNRLFHSGNLTNRGCLNKRKDWNERLLIWRPLLNYFVALRACNTFHSEFRTYTIHFKEIRPKCTKYLFVWNTGYEVHQKPFIGGHVQHLNEAKRSTAISSLLSYLRLFRRPQWNRRADDSWKVRGSWLRPCVRAVRGAGGVVSQVSRCLSRCRAAHQRKRLCLGVCFTHLLPSSFY